MVVVGGEVQGPRRSPCGEGQVNRNKINSHKQNRDTGYLGYTLIMQEQSLRNFTGAPVTPENQEKMLYLYVDATPADLTEWAQAQ